MVRIFIADDRDFVRSTLRQVLRQADADWEVCGEAANGREAIEKAIELAPDLIILDVAMPLLDGIGAAKAIRAELSEVPIVMLTFMSFEHLESMARQAGAQAVVQKGSLHALVTEIRRVLAAAPKATARHISVGDGSRPVLDLVARASEEAPSAGVELRQEEMADTGATGDTWPDGEVEPAI